MRLGGPSARTMGSLTLCCRSTAGIAPAVRHRSLRTLTLVERESISREIASGSSIREIAKDLKRATSTISRELARHGGRDWSPEQICGRLKIQYPKDESMRVSHETIYRSLFIQARGALKKELIQHLRFKRRIPRSRHSCVTGHHRGQIVDVISIRERPTEIEDRAIPGHWEGDLLRGTNNSHIATLVERHSRLPC